MSKQIDGQKMRDLADIIQEEAPGIGFALITFEFNNPNSMSNYIPLPALALPDGTVITCFELTDEEVEAVIRTRRIHFQQLTFNGPLQPIQPIIELGDDLNVQ